MKDFDLVNSDFEDSKFKKINVVFKGNSNPSADELVNMIKSMKEMLPKESRNNLKIESVAPGSVDILAWIQPVIDIFSNSDYDVFWGSMAKIATMYSLGSAVIKPIVKKFKKEGHVTSIEVKELLDILNDDPNSIRTIQKQDFVGLSKVAKIVEKRGEVTVKGDTRNRFFSITKEDAEVIQLVAQATDENDEYDINAPALLHLNIMRVSFQGKEAWKARILEEGDFKLKYITIEDQNLLYQVKMNSLFFSGKEVIEAMVRVETKNNIKKYYLTEYKKITTLNHVKYK